MGTYWDEFLYQFPWVERLPLVDVLELFWHWCGSNNGQKSTVFDDTVSRLKAERLLIDRDYSCADIVRMTGYNKYSLAAIKLHGQYYINGKRLFRREEVDRRRKLGLNLAVEE